MPKVNKVRKRAYCCLRKIQRCKTRMEANQPQVCIGNMRNSFNIFVGQHQSHLFENDDVMCNSCYIKVCCIRFMYVCMYN